jgi:RNA-directed DNA polymerase
MDLNNDKRQHIQLELDFSSSRAGEACGTGREETESPLAAHDTESPAITNRWMEEVCERDNLKKALQQVKANKGSAGIDRMTVGQLDDYLKQHGPVIREQLLKGTYEPKPVRRVEIPKPDGGVRKLGIPTVLDRLIQQLEFGHFKRPQRGSSAGNGYVTPAPPQSGAARATVGVTV